MGKQRLGQRVGPNPALPRMRDPETWKGERMRPTSTENEHGNKDIGDDLGKRAEVRPRIGMSRCAASGNGRKWLAFNATAHNPNINMHGTAG